MIQSLVLKIAIIDAFFCQGIKVPATIKLMPAQDMTIEKKPYGETCTKGRQFHGNQVLRIFIKNLKTKSKIEITPYKVFLKNGEQDRLALAKALSEIEKSKTDMVIMAIGFMKPDSLPKTLPTLTLAASGASGNGVRNDEKLWPQELTSENLILISHYFSSVTSSKTSLKGHFDPSSLYLNKTKFFVANPTKPEDFSGSSYAVAFAAAKVVSFCSPLKNLDSCLQKITQPLTILTSPLDKNYRTF